MEDLSLDAVLHFIWVGGCFEESDGLVRGRFSHLCYVPMMLVAGSSNKGICTEIGDALEQSLTVLTALHTLGLRGMSRNFV